MINWFEWGSWLNGLIAALIGGGAQGVVTALGLNYKDPQHWNMQTTALRAQVAYSFGVGATISFFMYLAKNTIPKVFRTEVVGTKTVTAPTGETTTTVLQKTTTVEAPASDAKDSKPEVAR
jgi:hypothetical protein